MSVPEHVRRAALQEADAEAWTIAADVARLAEQYREMLHSAKRRIREGSTPIG
jgi:hypothetical protein